MGLDAWAFWLILMALFIVIEVATINLITVWFAGGCLAAIIAALCGAPIYVQVAIAFGVSGILLAAVIIFKPFDKYKRKQNIPTNSDRMIGRTGVVLTKIDSVDAVGTVKVMGQVWSAVSEDGTAISEGEKIKVHGISGVKLVVSADYSEGEQ